MGGKWTFVVLVLLLGLIATNFFLDQRRSQTEGSEVGRLEGSIIPPEKVATAEKSVFLVKGAHFQATAFLVDNKCGIFATNAHVADAIGKDPAYLMQADTGKKYEIAKSRMHPGFKAFDKIVDAFGPMIVYGNGGIQTVPVSPGFDVALLYAKGIDCNKPSDLNAIPALHIADAATLDKLKAGDPIALIGFEGYGTTTRDVEWMTVSPRIEVGHVRAIGSSVPQPAGHHDPRLRQLVLHRLTTTPGSSGSPILDYAGDVIAVNEGRAAEDNEEDNINRERIGMRADLVSEMLTSTDAELIAKYKQPLTESLNAFKSASDTLQLVDKKSGPKLFARGAHLNAELSSAATEPAQFSDVEKKFSVGAKPGFPATSVKQRGRYKLFVRELKPNEAYMFSAIDYDMYVTFSDEQRKKYRKATHGGALIDRLCPLSIGVRRAGARAFSFVRTSQLPYLLVTPSRKARKLQLLVWRVPGCSPQSTAFAVNFSTFKIAPKAKNPAVSMLSDLSRRAQNAWSGALQDLRSDELARSFTD